MPHARRKQRRYNRHLQSQGLQLRRRRAVPPRVRLVKGVEKESGSQPQESGDSLNTYDLSEFPYLGNSAAWTSEDDEDVEKDSSKDYSEKPSEPWKSNGQKTIAEIFKPEPEADWFTMTVEDFPTLPAYPSPVKFDEAAPAGFTSTAPCSSVSSSWPSSEKASSSTPSVDRTQPSFSAAPLCVLRTETSKTTTLSSEVTRYSRPPTLTLTTATSSSSVGRALPAWAAQSFSTNTSTAGYMPYKWPSMSDSPIKQRVFPTRNSQISSRIFPNTLGSELNGQCNRPALPFHSMTTCAEMMNEKFSRILTRILPERHLIPNFPLVSRGHINQSRTSESACGTNLHRLESRPTMTDPLHDVLNNKAECEQKYNISSKLVDSPNLFNSHPHLSRNRASSASNTCNICGVQKLDADFNISSQPGIQYHRSATPYSPSSTWFIFTDDPSKPKNSMTCGNEQCREPGPFPLGSSIWQFDRSDMPSSFGTSRNQSDRKEKAANSSEDVNLIGNMPDPFPLGSSIWQFDWSEMLSSFGSSKNQSDGKEKAADSSEDANSKENIPSTAENSRTFLASIPEAEARGNDENKSATGDRRTSDNYPNLANVTDVGKFLDVSNATDNWQADKTENVSTSDAENEKLSQLPMFEGHLGTFLKKFSPGSDGNQAPKDISSIDVKGKSGGVSESIDIPPVAESMDSCQGEKNTCMASNFSSIQSDTPTLANDTASRNSTHQNEAKMELVTSLPDGQVLNIPSSMLADQFGMAGLLVRIRSAETNPDLLDLSYGFNFSSYLDCDESTPVWPTFDGPWSDEKAARLQDIDCDLIPEYRMDMETRAKLNPITLSQYSDDVLFFLFYTNPREMLQLIAAAALFSRDWRYHKVEKAWMRRIPGSTPRETTPTYEIGEFYFFDVKTWRKIIVNTRVVADDLVDRVATYSALNDAHSSIRRRSNNDMRMVDITRENPSIQNTASMVNPSIINTSTSRVRNIIGSSMANTSDQNTYSVSDARNEMRSLMTNLGNGQSNLRPRLQQRSDLAQSEPRRH